MSTQLESFESRVSANVEANRQRRQDSWAKRDAYFLAKDKLVAEMKAQGIVHTHGDCQVCKAIEALQF